MIIYSEKTGEKYPNQEECLKAEQLYDENKAKQEEEKKTLALARKDRAKEVEDAYQKVLDAEKEFQTVLNKFVDDYGAFHMTLSDRDHDGDAILESMAPFNMMNAMFRNLFF